MNHPIAHIGLVGEFLHPFAAHPGKSGGVSWDMTKATRAGYFGLFAGRERQNASAGCAVALGPYTYLPAPVHAPGTINGTLTRGDLPVALEVTEPLLRDFLDSISALQADLARRWVGPEGRSAVPRPE